MHIGASTLIQTHREIRRRMQTHQYVHSTHIHTPHTQVYYLYASHTPDIVFFFHSTACKSNMYLRNGTVNLRVCVCVNVTQRYLLWLLSYWPIMKI